MSTPVLSRRRLLALSLRGAALAASGCVPPGRRTASATTAAGYVPPAGDAWAGVDAASAGWDAAGLDDVLDLAGDRGTRALVILHGGRILRERYWRGWTRHTARDVASVQKSVVSLLVARARELGLLRGADPVSDHLGAGWSRAGADREGAVTVGHLLSMTSGLDDTLAYEADPGTRWRYGNNAYHVLHGVLEAAAGRSLTQLSEEWLWGPAHMAASSWRDRPGDTGASGEPLAGLRATARDLARFGLLVQRGGDWGGDALLGSAHVAAATRSSSALNPAYGRLWWLNGQDAYLLPRGDAGAGPIAPRAPRDLVAALGAGDQVVAVAASLDLVVVRLGRSAGGEPLGPGSFLDDLGAALTAAAPGAA